MIARHFFNFIGINTMITSTQAKSARLELGISQNKVAKDTSLSRQYLINFELGKYNPNQDFQETLKAYYSKNGVIFENKQDEVMTTKPKNRIMKNFNLIAINTIITPTQAKSARLKMGISQNKVAVETGLSRPYLCNFEVGKFNPNDDFKETLKAYYLKEGIIFKEKQYDEVMTIKPINGIIPDVDYVSYAEAENIMEDITEFNAELFDLSEQPLPTKDDGVIFEKIVIDDDEVKRLIDDTVRKMAKAYLDIMSIIGEHSFNAKPCEDIPPLDELKSDSDYSVNDYVLCFINKIDDDCDDEEV